MISIPDPEPATITFFLFTNDQDQEDPTGEALAAFATDIRRDVEKDEKVFLVLSVKYRRENICRLRRLYEYSQCDCPIQCVYSAFSCGSFDIIIAT